MKSILLIEKNGNYSDFLVANTLVPVTLVGMRPLILKRLKLDPVLVFSPLLTTVTEMCVFFFVLSFVAAVLPKFGGI